MLNFIINGVIMKFKKLIILTIVLIAILSIGVVCAANQTDDSILSNNDDIDEISIDYGSILESEENMAEDNSDILSFENQSSISQSTVTPDNFFDYFNSDGSSKTEDDLTFEGEFNHPVNAIRVSSQNINGQNAIFKNMGVHASDDVTINGLTLISDNYVSNEEGSLIYATGSDVVLQNIVLNYNSDDGESFYAIFFSDCHNFKLLNSKIKFEGNNLGEVYQYGLKIVDSSQGLIDGNSINVSVPIQKIDFNKEGLNKDLSLGMGIQHSEDIKIQNNDIHTIVNGYYNEYPTLDTIMVIDSSHIVFSSNNISETDFITSDGVSNYLYAMDFYNSNNVLIEKNNLSVKTKGGSKNAGTSYPIQLSGPYSNVTVDNNRISANCGGPVLGIFSHSTYGETELLVKNNFINVTGLPTSNKWGLVSGIEVQDYYAYIYNNTIHVQSVGDFQEDMCLYGISYAQDLPEAENHYDIKDNTIYTQGKYGIYLLIAKNSNITDNEVHSTFTDGADTVYVGDGENNNIKDNTLIADDLDNVVTPLNFFDFFESDGSLKDGVTYDQLIFKGEFTNIVDYIRISRPISIRGNDAVLNNIGFYIDAERVSLKNLKLISNKSLNDGLIYICGVSIDLTDLNINYTVNDEEAIVINAKEADKLNILNNYINFESHVSVDTTNAMAINVLDCNNVLIENNEIHCFLPAISADTRDEDYQMMGLTYISPLKIKNTKNIKLINNILNSNTNEIFGEFPTIQSIFVIGSENVLFDKNKISVIDKLFPIGRDSYLYGINFGYNKNITVSNNDFKMSTPGGKEAAGTAYALEGVKSDIKIIGNNISTSSNGPNIGIYITSMGGEESEEYIANNFINVTGLATATGSWALVTGIEIQNGRAKIYNNTIYTRNVGQYNDSAYCYGISYAQWMYGNRTFDIQDNTIVTNGKYTISTVATKETESTPIMIKNNRLTAHDLYGEESIQICGVNSTIPDDTENQTSNGTVGNITIDVGNVWINTDNVVTVTISNATGSITLIINGKTYTANLINGVATKTLPSTDLMAGENVVTVNYNDLSNSATFKVLNGIVTSENVLDYFNQSNEGKLNDCIPDGATLDFQGEIKAANIGKLNIYINKAINMISSTEDAFIDLNTVAGDYDGSSPGDKFTIDKSGSRTNVTGITFHNTQVWVYNADYVTLDNISVIVEDQRVGSGVGATSIRQNSTYVTVKNSYFYTKNNGGSSSLVIAWANYCTFDRNTVIVEGNVGNAIYITTFNVGIPEGVRANIYNNITNNFVRANPMTPAICNAITFAGANNLIENNTVIHSAAGIVSQDGLDSSSNIFRNNNLSGGAFMNVLPDSLVYNNYVSGKMTLKDNVVAYNNTVGGLVIAGDDVNAYNNTIKGAVQINKVVNSQIKDSTIIGDISFERDSQNNTLSDSNVTGTVSIRGVENNILNNYISSRSDYAVTITKNDASGNIVTGNRIYASALYGSEAVNDQYKKNHIYNNFPLTSELIVNVNDIKVGDVETVLIFIPEDAAGAVKIILNDVENLVTINKGEGEVTLTDLDAGNYTIKVVFEGDSVYSAKETTATFEVSKYDISIANNVSVDVQDSGNVTFTIDLNNDITGNITVKINNGEYKESLVNGKATVEISDLNAGSYSAQIIYSGDKKYNSASTNRDFTVKGEITLDVYVENIHVGDVAYINVTTDSRVNNVVVILNEEYNLELNNGKGTLPISNLGCGNYSVMVIFNGNSELLDKSINKTFSVSKVDLSQDSISINNDFKAPEFTIDTFNDVTGRLNVKINASEYNENIVKGAATVKVSNLAPGTYTAWVSYLGDYKYNSISKEFNFIIKENVELSVDVNDIYVGDIAYINITTNSHVNEVIVILNNETTVSIVNGKGNISIPSLTYGKHTITVKFEGTDYLFANETTVDFIVSRITIPNDCFVEKNNIFSVELPADATGEFTVKVEDNSPQSAEIIYGKADIIVSNLNPGDYDVLMSYSGDGKYENLSKTTTLNIPKWESSISANVSDVNVGDDVVFDVKVTNGATGIVNVIIDGKKYNGTINAGLAKVIISNLSNGTYEAIVKYDGDNNYLGNETSKTFKVSKVDITDEWFDVNGKIVKATLPGDATGSVTISIGLKEVNDNVIGGNSSITLDLTPGTYDGIIAYSGDGKYNGISDNIQIIVPKYDAPISVNVNDVLVGEDVIFNVVLPIHASGNVTIFVGENDYSGTIDGGKVTITVGDLPLDNYTALIKYAGDSNYTDNQTEVKFSVSTIIIPDVDKVIEVPDSDSSNPTYSIDLENAGGNLTVYVDGEIYKTTPLVDGKASINLTDVASGKHNITVEYSGDGRYAKISKNTTVSIPEKVVPAPVIKLTGSDISMLYTSGAVYTVRLTSDGNALEGQTIVFTVNGKRITAVTDKNGYASAKIDLPPKSSKYTLTASYGDVKATNYVKVNSIISAKNLKVKKSAKTLKIKVTLKKVNGKYLKSKKVTLKFKGKTYKAKTNKKGVATFKLNKKVIKKLKAGKKYKYQAIYLKDTVKKTISVKK